VGQRPVVALLHSPAPAVEDRKTAGDDPLGAFRPEADLDSLPTLLPALRERHAASPLGSPGEDLRVLRQKLQALTEQIDALSIASRWTTIVLVLLVGVVVVAMLAELYVLLSIIQAGR
jgi:hypothetical protein